MCQATKSFYQEMHNSQSSSQILHHIQSLPHPCSATSNLRYIQPSSCPTFSKSSSVSKTSSIRSRTSPLRDFQLPEVFPTPSQRPWSLVHQDLCLLLRNTILPALKTCNALILKRAVIRDSRFTIMQSWLINASNHGRYNKSSTCRSCSYNHPLILPPRQQ